MRPRRINMKKEMKFDKKCIKQQYKKKYII